MIEHLLAPFFRVFTEPPEEWHPLVIHFPIVFLMLEAVLIGIFCFTKNPNHERNALYALRIAVISLAVAALAGFHDAGAGLGEGNPFILGFQNRIKNFFNFMSPLTVHLWLALSLIVLTLIRFFWREIKGKNALLGLSGILYCFFTLLSLWVLISTAYMGGMLSQK